jgi:RNA-binding protein
VLRTMPLSERQCKYLRRLGHALKPVVLIGTRGLSGSVLTEVDTALEHHELIKVRVRAVARAEREAMLTKVLEHSKAELIQRVGYVALIYRRAEKPRIVLPPRQD